MTANDNRQDAGDLEDVFAEMLWRFAEGLRAEFASQLSALEGRLAWVEDAWHIVHAPEDQATEELTVSD